METQKGPYKDDSPSKKGTIWVSMLVWGSVGLGALNPARKRGAPPTREPAAVVAVRKQEHEASCQMMLTTCAWLVGNKGI